MGVGGARKWGGRRRRRRGRLGANSGRGARVGDDVVDGTTCCVIIGYGHCTGEMKKTQRKKYGGKIAHGERAKITDGQMHSEWGEKIAIAAL